ncbi:fumarylacetoacetate hydrolase family protein [Fulvimarina sp. 2208YS6-2-32]|uniref:Fumarylacetoacetate hydrolase family protein n=1 Tax=Fulvimarina uroteuthidis TaxID=3098149 RepID=A0ABU5HXM6_9HYPH|nr:fumarylacetoacetate hydrolase family protein [Fulvimarina sp. 2208YS6-2-32]MDY8107893.1 fumarylacetoacetate hydrolase family protein [Fulvimarina sp. 2208YS6-2-32]
MRLVRFGKKGSEKPGLIDDDHVLRDLSGEVDDIAGEVLRKPGMARLAALDPKSLPKVDPSHRLGAPVGRIGHFIAIGLNYADHAEETGAEAPAEPMVFSKAPSCISGAHDELPIPPGSTKLDWEVELAIVIGDPAFDISEDRAMDHIAGFCLCNDVSERAFQKERGGQFIKGKSAPGFGPLGPWLVTPDRLGDPQALDLWLNVNGETRQRGTTKDMLFSAAFIVAYLSKFMLLESGDVITTGTPAGVGAGMKPPQFLKDGDIVTLGINGLGEQRQVVKAA